MSESTAPYEHNGEYYPAYTPPSDEQLLSMCARAEQAFLRTFNEIGLISKDYYIDFNVFNEALIRTDQRKLHYMMYHSGMIMNELKRIAVLSYWIIRLKPIHRIAGGPIDVNEQVVIDWIFKSVATYRKRMNLPKPEFGEKLKADLLYALTYRDISYDYMTLLVEGLAA